MACLPCKNNIEAHDEWWIIVLVVKATLPLLNSHSKFQICLLVTLKIFFIAKNQPVETLRKRVFLLHFANWKRKLGAGPFRTCILAWRNVLFPGERMPNNFLALAVDTECPISPVNFNTVGIQCLKGLIGLTVLQLSCVRSYLNYGIF